MILDKFKHPKMETRMTFLSESFMQKSILG